jgi:hypothetical protein
VSSNRMKDLAAGSLLVVGSIAGTSLGCASTPAKSTAEPVRFYDAYRQGTEALPARIEGCQPLGSVSASVPELEGGAGFFDPQPLLETLDARARRKGADTAVVLLEPGHLQRGSRTLRATVFHCGDQPVPAGIGFPLE